MMVSVGVGNVLWCSCLCVWYHETRMMGDTVSGGYS